jgi:O-antigen ligase
MEKVFYIKDSIENRISYYHLVCFLIALPFDSVYSTIILMSFVLHTLIFFRWNQLRNINKAMLIMQSVFFVTLISSIYARSFTDGIHVAFKQLAILVFPFLLAVGSLDIKKYRHQLFRVLAVTSTLVVLYLYFEAMHVIFYNRLPLSSLFSWAFVNQNFSLPIGTHATYLSMLLLMSFVFFLAELLRAPKNKPLFYLICLAILLAGIIQLSSKSVFAALIIILIIGFPWLFISKKYRYRFLVISVTLCTLVVISLLSLRIFRDRLIATFEDDLYENRSVVKINGRLDRWNIAIDLIKKNPVAGTGSGSEIPLLKQAYYNQKMYWSYLNSLNAHNQYLSFLITSGFPGLIVYLLMLFWGLRRSVQQRDILLFSFIVLITVVSFSEDLLDVNKGIFFYAFFFPILILGQSPNKQRQTFPVSHH